MPRRRLHQPRSARLVCPNVLQIVRGCAFFQDGGAEPDAKRLKPTPPDPAVVRKQVGCIKHAILQYRCALEVEYYLSDENLKYDKFFHDKISANAEGWLDAR